MSDSIKGSLQMGASRVNPTLTLPCLTACGAIRCGAARGVCDVRGVTNQMGVLFGAVAQGAAPEVQRVCGAHRRRWEQCSCTPSVDGRSPFSTSCMKSLCT